LEADADRLLKIISGTEQAENIIVFKLNEEIWSTSLENVARVIRTKETTFHRHHSDIRFLHGFIFFQRKVVPVVTINRLLDLEEFGEITSRTAILICRIKDFVLGILVDDVLELIPTDESSISTIPGGYLKDKYLFFTGALNWRNEVCLHFEVDELFSDEDVKILSEEGKKIEEGHEGA